MAKISKRTRFDVFKRDGFQCQYCGRKPPEVVLEVDHIFPTCKGGSDRKDNLLTACMDCNRGKSGIPLDVVPQTVADKIAEKIERAEQLKAYHRLLAKERKRETDTITQLGYQWFNHFMEANRFTFGSARVPTIRTFLRHLAPTQIMDAIEIAFRNLPLYSDDDERTFKYFCGICWKMIREGEDP